MNTQNLDNLQSLLLGHRDAAAFRFQNSSEAFSIGYYRGLAVAYGAAAEFVADEIKKHFQHSNN